jgi:diguanylate cyclase (GGDEF)-like protein
LNKLEKYEHTYIKLSWLFIIIGYSYSVYLNIFAKDNNQCHFGIPIVTVSFLVLLALNYYKMYIVKKGLFSNNLVYITFRLVELFCVSFAIIYTGCSWAYLVIVFPIIVTSLIKGHKFGLFLLSCSFVMHMAFMFSERFIIGHNSMGKELNNSDFFIVVLLYIVLLLLVELCNMIYKEGSNNEEENKSLVTKLEEKYQQLAVVQDEIKIQYDKMKETNVKLEDSNKRLTTSIAEFYTLQQISQAISSIFDIKELLKYVNDIILGVMGVNNSTIILYDEKKKRLKVNISNIKSREELALITDNINSEIFIGVLKSSKPIIENFVDHDDYPFTQGRDVNSLICIPLFTKSRKFGLVLIEHKYYNAFDEENLRLLEIIGQQVGIAMENAELYQQMQELATIDGLTGMYNRLYFQERLEKEFNNAQDGNYDLSLAIFDIDFFKRFNDTFGHLFGDKVLKSIAELVKGSLRNSDVLARFGGEEFIILFPRTNLNEAYEKVEALRAKISQLIVKDSLVTASVTVSFGIASFPECSGTETELLRFADDALYDAKNSGRNCIKVAELR